MRAFASSESEGLIGWMWRTIPIFRGKQRRHRLSAFAAEKTDVALALKQAGLDERGRKKQSKIAFDDESTINSKSGSGSKESPRIVGAVSTVEDEGVAGPTKASDSSSKYVEVSKSAAATTPAHSHSAAQLARERASKFGFIFIGLRPTAFITSLLFFFISCWCAIVTVFFDNDSNLKLFLFALMWITQTMIIAVQLPYEALIENSKKIVVGLATLAHSTLLLAIQSDGTKSQFFYTIMAIFAVLVIFLLFRRKIPLEMCQAPVRSVRKHEEQVKQREQKRLAQIANGGKKQRTASVSKSSRSASSSGEDLALKAATTRAASSSVSEESRSEGATEGHAAAATAAPKQEKMPAENAKAEGEPSQSLSRHSSDSLVESDAATSSARHHKQVSATSILLSPALAQAEVAIRQAKEKKRSESKAKEEADEKSAVEREIARLEKEEQEKEAAEAMKEILAVCTFPPTFLQVFSRLFDGKPANVVSTYTEEAVHHLLQTALAAYQQSVRDHAEQMQKSAPTSSSVSQEAAQRLSQRLSQLVGDWNDVLQTYDDVFNTAMLRPTLTSTRSQHDLLTLVATLHANAAAHPSGFCLSDEQTDVQSAAIELMRHFDDLTPLLEQMHAEVTGHDALLADLAASRVQAKAAAADARAIAEAESVLGSSISSLAGAPRTAVVVAKKIELSLERQVLKAKATRAQAEANVAARSNMPTTVSTSSPSLALMSPLSPSVRRQPSVSAGYKHTAGFQQLHMLLKRPLDPLTSAPSSLPQIRVGRRVPPTDSPIASPSHAGAPGSPLFVRRSSSSSEIAVPSPIQSPTGVHLQGGFSPLSSPSKKSQQ
jgi:hypothetical protein